MPTDFHKDVAKTLRDELFKRMIDDLVHHCLAETERTGVRQRFVLSAPNPKDYEWLAERLAVYFPETKLEQAI